MTYHSEIQEFSKKGQGIIALDIDGTITAVRDHLDDEVIKYLKNLNNNGWHLFFVTGRTFFWSHHLLERVDFPYTIATHNGACLVSMPEKKILSKKYLLGDELEAIEQLVKSQNSACVVYTGIESDERSYYCPRHFSQEKLSYLARRASSLKEKWKALSSFEELPLVEFISIRCFELPAKAKKIAQEIQAKLKLNAHLMTDSFDSTFSVLSITDSSASKGSALQEVILKEPPDSIIIAAGDDLNDIPMLKLANIRIVMQTAPEEVKTYADILAPSAKEHGIISGLEQALHFAAKKN